jgi:hypothetical protein
MAVKQYILCPKIKKALKEIVKNSNKANSFYSSAFTKALLDYPFLKIIKVYPNLNIGKIISAEFIK